MPQSSIQSQLSSLIAASSTPAAPISPTQMASLRCSAPTTAISRDAAFNLRTQNASSCAASAGLQISPMLYKNQQEAGENESLHHPQESSASTDPRFRELLLRHGNQFPSQTTMDPAVSWSSDLTSLRQSAGELHPYDLRNAILPGQALACSQQQSLPPSIDVGRLINATGRYLNGREGWDGTAGCGGFLSQSIASETYSSRDLELQEQRHEAFPFQDHRIEQTLKGDYPQYLHPRNQTTAESPASLATMRGEGMAREWNTTSSNLSSPISETQSSATAMQSSKILTFHNNMSKLSVPIPNLNIQQTAFNSENQSHAANGRMSELQDGASLNRNPGLADEDGNKRNPSLAYSDSEDGSTNGLSKRLKLADPAPPLTAKAQATQTQGRKEKLGEKITALQQLVSPFGKTDTASVLLEAIGYIKFLQEQVQVLSSPYMKPSIRQESGKVSSRSKVGEAGSDLRSRGLCLVPVSCTVNVANNNGADYWTSGIGGSTRY